MRKSLTKISRYIYKYLYGRRLDLKRFASDGELVKNTYAPYNLHALDPIVQTLKLPAITMKLLVLELNVTVGPTSEWDCYFLGQWVGWDLDYTISVDGDGK